MPPAKKPSKQLKVTVSTRIDPALKRILVRAAKPATLSKHIETILMLYADSLNT